MVLQRPEKSHFNRRLGSVVAVEVQSNKFPKLPQQSKFTLFVFKEELHINLIFTDKTLVR